ncbi:helix-turn-helix domain-containing protein [Trinickia sp. NRRL B-1857]|uniref:helix-turn-helix domain-containing protein n=1 Tax=Trinickia sp. NRRL B-1857 TaxID=3162879 RepID=UPI003D29AA23
MATEHVTGRDYAGDWVLVEDLQHHLSQSSFDVPASVMAEIAMRLEDALAGASKADIASVSSGLAAVVKEAIRHAPQESVDAALGEGEPDQSVKAAHLLGQLGFAQLLAAQVASRRVEDDFAELIAEGTWRPYANALYETELRNVDLAAALDFDEATVSRELRKLRERGVTDFWRRGREVFNFLTPAAHQVMVLLSEREQGPAERGAKHVQPRGESGFDLRQSAAVKAAMNGTEPFLRGQTTLAIAPECELAL